MALIDPDSARERIHQSWAEEIVPALERYVVIPNKSPAFDARWREHGHMAEAVSLVAQWCRERPLPGLSLEVVELDGRTPLIFMEMPGAVDDTVLLYGHLDKQPEMTGWREGLGPWQPVLDGEKLYGRGGADDGYAAFASLLALEVLSRAGAPHARCVVMIEASEESGSPDLPAYVEHLRGRIGTPSLVICLDSGCGDYERLWGTVSLRGMASGTLRVEVLDEGVHSGDASGVVPSSFRIARQLLSRIEDESSGEIRLPALHAPIPDDRQEQARQMARALGEAVYTKYPFAGSTRPVHPDPTELILNRTWRPTLSVTGIDGAPPVAQAGNVLRASTTLRLSLRLPPTVDAAPAMAEVERVLETDPPYGARVRFESDGAANGWNAPPLAAWLEQAAAEASRTWFGPPAAFMGEGGSIPFMGMLGERFPDAQFLITGVLGPGSNAHGPNEFLHLPTARRLTGCVAELIAAHATR